MAGVALPVRMHFCLPPTSQEDSLMKNARQIVVSALASLILVAAVWAWPSPTINHSTHPSATGERASAQPQSVSGKIASVAKDSFTLNLTPSQTAAPGKQFQQEPSSPKTMTFLIDKNTTVEGNLKVNANADVTYREEGGSNVAISVRITQ
jgi:hypothetical protein